MSPEIVPNAQAMVASWRDIPSCPGYAASDYGRIQNTRTGRLLGGTDDRYGYRYVNIMVGGQTVRRKVHRLVCEAWHGPPNVLHRECGHLDGDKQNNRAANLKWVSRCENVQHNVRHGVHGGGISGERHPSAKLSDDQVAELRSKAVAGRSGRSLAREYGILSAHASGIIRGDRRKPQGCARKLSSSPCAGEMVDRRGIDVTE